MFINCPHCRALVATDLATDIPPELCPQCQGPLRETNDTPRDDDAQSHDAPMRDTDESTVVADTRSELRDTTVADEDHDDNTMATETGEDTATSPTTTDDTVALRDSALASGDDSRQTEAATVAAPSHVPTRRRAGQATPSFARTHAETTSTPRTLAWPTIAAIIGLSALFALQMLLADRARLATNVRWRPLLETLCGALACDLPPWREPAAFAILQRDVRQHPTVPGALRVSASFRNEARWPQPWPRLHLTLSDVNGRAAGERRFEASEYLGGAPEQPALASGETASVAMDIMEPAAHIVAYDFRFD